MTSLQPTDEEVRKEKYEARRLFRQNMSTAEKDRIRDAKQRDRDTLAITDPAARQAQKDKNRAKNDAKKTRKASRLAEVASITESLPIDPITAPKEESKFCFPENNYQFASSIKQWINHPDDAKAPAACVPNDPDPVKDDQFLECKLCYEVDKAIEQPLSPDCCAAVFCGHCIYNPHNKLQ